MLNSNERMSFIIEYLSAYQEKIKLANKHGLFDSAKMFELFAIEICKLWFQQDFENLNTNGPTYPYVDLISLDKTLFVQVSTNQDVPQKIKATLEKIRDSKNPKYSAINCIFFFVLHNDSIKRIKDYIGSNQIGKVSFTVKDNLITTNNIIEKAQNDLDFEIKLYNLLKKEFDSFSNNSSKFHQALDFSRNVGLMEIDTFINGEYEIDRSDIINRIISDDAHFISIQGTAGCGKSALCKKILENEEYVLYARAERFAEENSIDNIWGFHIEDTFNLLTQKKIIIFIDALEFIADVKTKLQLIHFFYSVVSRYNNVYIITSCRTSEKSAFIKLESLFNVQTYEIGELTNQEIEAISHKYPIIEKMAQSNSYNSLLKSPFYINMLITNEMSFENITNENMLRTDIWQNIICLKNKAKQYNLKYNDIINAINVIVFERAKKFLLGVSIDIIDSDILRALISEGVVSEINGLVRLKYDIFEDICFENYFDQVFDNCKNNYKEFYCIINDLGRCVYRRYQIWISNKLFIRLNRDKFIHILLFSEIISHEWKEQTIIGIVKSKYCSEFFDEQGIDIFENNLLEDFIKVINLFAFEAKIVHSDKQTPYLYLSPTGQGRLSMLQLIFEKNYYKSNNLKSKDIVKMCSDYVKSDNRKNEIDTLVSTMMIFYIEQVRTDSRVEYYSVIEQLIPYLTVLYYTPIPKVDWIKKYWLEILNDFKNGNHKQQRIASDVINWSLENAFPTLFPVLSNEMCLLANAFWFQHQGKNKNHHYISRLSDDWKYGLSDEGENYSINHYHVKTTPFLWNLFHLDFKTGFKWAIDFINQAIFEFAQNATQDICIVKLKLIESGEIYEYYGNNSLWIAGIQDHPIPTIIGDIIYYLKDFLIKNIGFHLNDTDLCDKFANYVKNTIYKHSNNIALLTIIESIGMHFESELPGYALDLATSLELIHFDVSRYMLYKKSPTQTLLEKNIMLSFGITELPDRYEIDPKCDMTLQTYVARAQIGFDSNIQQMCYQVIDYLYSITDRTNTPAETIFQIQKMDLRNADVTKVDDNILSFQPKIAKEIESEIKKYEAIPTYRQNLESKIKEFNGEITSGKLEISVILEIIDGFLYAIEKDPMPFQYENGLIDFIIVAFHMEELTSEKRSSLCEIWLSLVQKVFSNSYVSELNKCYHLFNQLNLDISQSVKNQIKKLLLKCLISNGAQGLIYQLSNVAKGFLRKNSNLSKALFHTIIKLSEDEMDHQKFNANYLKNIRKNESFDFIPNMQPKLHFIDNMIDNNPSQKSYISQKDPIIDKYLLNEESINLQFFDISNFDICTLCFVSNCGMSLEDNDFRKIIRSVIECIINIYQHTQNEMNSHEIIDTYHRYEIQELFHNQVIQNNKDVKFAIDILFDDIDFSKFTSKTVEFYQHILSNFVPEFFDAYKDTNRRIACINKIYYLENKVNKIDNLYVKYQLQKALIFSVDTISYVDWSKCKTKYSYKDKDFLNRQFNKYGKYHFKSMLLTIYKLHINELLPEILVSLCNCIKYIASNSDCYLDDGEYKILNKIIMNAFLNHSDQIKQDQELIISFETILKILIDLNYEEAAILLDEFRVH